MTGGIGAGKSAALAAFARHGAAVISSDEIVHRLLRDDGEVRRALVERFGAAILDEAGHPDRAAIGRIVFRDREALDWLERLLHPRVTAAQRSWREELARRADPPALAVIEIPLLYETGGETRFDAVVTITAPRSLRASRSRTSLECREARLLPEEEKVKRADYSYVNDGSLEALDAFVRSVVEQLLRRS